MYAPPVDASVPRRRVEEQDHGLPDGARRLRDRLVTADACIIAAPEYNASMPGVLKNAVDWVSRFRPQPRSGFVKSTLLPRIGGSGPEGGLSGQHLEPGAGNSLGHITTEARGQDEVEVGGGGHLLGAEPAFDRTADRGS